MRPALCTAIVSTYGAERFLRGCLEDLLAQTAADRLEIIVVDACSPENEAAIVREFEPRHPRLRYVRTETRVNTSEAFNLATGMATGRYLTTANTDDRHHPEFVERMCAVLDAHPDVALAYADSRITTVENETWQHNSARVRYAWPDYTHTTALSCCLFGAQAVWRREVHADVGPWDPAIRRANDQDMFLRIALHGGAVHVREDLGLFLQRSESESGPGNRDETLREVLAVMRRHRRQTPIEVLFPRLATVDEPLGRAAAWLELGNLCVLGPYTDAEFALECYQHAWTAAGSQVRYAFATNVAAVLACAGAAEQAERAWRLAGDGSDVRHNREQLARGAARLTDMRFVGIDHPAVQDSRTTRAVTFAGPTALREQLPWDVYDGPNGEPIAPDGHVVLVMYGWAESGGGTMLPRAFAARLAATGRRVAVIYAAAGRRPELPPYAVVRHHEDGVELFGICNRPSDFMDLSHPEREVDDPAVRAVFGQLLDELCPGVVHFWNLHNLGMSLPGECRRRGVPTVLSSNNYWALCPRLYLISERLERCSGASVDGSKCGRCLGATEQTAGYADRRDAGVAMLRDDIDVHLAVSTRVRELYVRNGDDPAHVRVLRQEPPSASVIWAATGAHRQIVMRLERPLRVGYVGSVMAHKGVHVLAAALQQVPVGAVEAVALGDVGAEYAAVLRQVDREGRLHLAGRYEQAKLARLLAALDVVVVPSVWDDCAPFVVAEALAARCPVVGSAIGGIPDFVRHRVNGLLFEAGNAGRLAECLMAFAREPELLGRLQRAIEPPRGLAAFTEDVCEVYAELRSVRPAGGWIEAAGRGDHGEGRSDQARGQTGRAALVRAE